MTDASDPRESPGLPGPPAGPPERLLASPAGGALVREGRVYRCAATGARYGFDGGVLDFLVADGAGVERGEAAARVEAFYDRAPFPGYAPGDDAAGLLDRSRRSSFLRDLDAALAPGATLLDAGCGTGQLAAFLALAGPRRTVLGVDGCRASLREADGFRTRAPVPNLHLLRGDLFRLPLAPGAFDAVICRGVVHHTPDPDRATAEVASRVARGGVLVLGFYESVGRLPHAARRGLHRVCPPLARRLDPVLRRSDVTGEKQRRWIEDQYRHPLERRLPLPQVMAHLRELGFDVLRSVPPALPAGSPPRALFDPDPPRRVALRRLGWLLSGLNDPDAGLVMVLARRRG